MARSLAELDEAVAEPGTLTDGTLDALRRQADWLRADLNRDLQVRRRGWDQEGLAREARRELEAPLALELEQWDDARRALHRGEWPGYVAEAAGSTVLKRLIEATRERLNQRPG